MIIFVCDKCKTQADAKQTGTGPPSDWQELRFTAGYRHNHLHYLLCPKCQEDLKLPKDNNFADLGEQLLEIIAEIAHDSVEH